MPTPNTLIPIHSSDRNDFINITALDAKASPNFTFRELFNVKVGQSSHPLSRQVIACAQYLRDRFGLPMMVTSTYRTYVPVGGASYSPHMMGVAIDLQFHKSHVPQSKRDELYTIIRDDFENKGEIFQALWSLGCRGFGIYDSFIHIDTAHVELYPKMRSKRGTVYQGDQYASWNKMNRLRYISAPRPDSSSSSSLGIEDNGVPETLLEDNIIGRAVLEGAGTAAGLVEELFNDEDRLEGVSGNGLLKMITVVLSIGVGLLGLFYLFFK